MNISRRARWLLSAARGKTMFLWKDQPVHSFSTPWRVTKQDDDGDAGSVFISIVYSIQTIHSQRRNSFSFYRTAVVVWNCESRELLRLLNSDCFHCSICILELACHNATWPSNGNLNFRNVRMHIVGRASTSSSLLKLEVILQEAMFTWHATLFSLTGSSLLFALSSIIIQTTYITNSSLTMLWEDNSQFDTCTIRKEIWKLAETSVLTLCKALIAQY